ncbi:hypothetical protein KM043_003515 [Ampulex compressa]|nr:hypothetical protein KM043_003515 [Ampulex compressa]
MAYIPHGITIAYLLYPSTHKRESCINPPPPIALATASSYRSPSRAAAPSARGPRGGDGIKQTSQEGGSPGQSVDRAARVVTVERASKAELPAFAERDSSWRLRPCFLRESSEDGTLVSPGDRKLQGKVHRASMFRGALERRSISVRFQKTGRKNNEARNRGENFLEDFQLFEANSISEGIEVQREDSC